MSVEALTPTQAGSLARLRKVRAFFRYRLSHASMITTAGEERGSRQLSLEKEKRLSVKTPEFSVCATLYNNATRVKNSLDSILKAMEGLGYEIIIVDNFSVDGSFEIVESYAKELGNIRVVRKKCSRGGGRRLAVELSAGKYVIWVNADMYYDPSKFRLMIDGYMKSKHTGTKCLVTRGTGVFPRDILLRVGNFRDLQRDSALDLATRLYAAGVAVYLPVLISSNENIRTFASERINFVKNPFRILRVKRDIVCSHAITLRKALLALRYKDGAGIGKTLVTCLGYVLLVTINSISGLETFHSHPILSNDVYNVRQAMKNLVNPVEFGFKPGEVDEKYHPEHPKSKYVMRLFPDTREGFARLRLWKSGVPS